MRHEAVGELTLMASRWSEEMLDPDRGRAAGLKLRALEP
jgi:hypothetical protein